VDGRRPSNQVEAQMCKRTTLILLLAAPLVLAITPSLVGAEASIGKATVHRNLHSPRG